MTDYYVDSSVGGPGSGTIGDPWDDISSNINSLSAGDTMYLRGGVSYQIYNEARITVSVSGTSGNPITIRPYPGEKVKIRCTTTTHQIFDLNANYIHIYGDNKNLYLDKEDNADSCISIDGDNNTVEEVELANSAYISIITIGDGNYDNNTILNCLIHDNYYGASTDAPGILLLGGTGTLIDGCEIYGCHGDCIVADDGGSYACGTITIQNCELYTGESSYVLGQCYEGGIDIKDGNATITGNTLYGFYECTGTCGASGGPGAAITVQNSCTGATITSNIIYDSSVGIAINVDNVTAHSNVIYDLHDSTEDPNAGGGSGALIGIWVYGTSSGVNIYNNTLDDCPDQGLYLASTSAGVTLKNNIFNNCDAVEAHASASYTSEYNCFYNCTTVTAGLRSGNDVNSDPLFVGGGDYHLQSGSPCIDSGTDLGLGDDMGAYQYTGTSVSCSEVGYWPGGSYPYWVCQYWTTTYWPRYGLTLLPPVSTDFTLPAIAYKVRIYNTSGTLVAEVTDFYDLVYTKKVNAPGLAQIELSGDHDAIALLGHKYQVEVWRRMPRYGMDWYCDFYGLFMGQERYYTDQPYFLMRCPGQMTMLAWRHVMWAAGTDDRSAFGSTPAETIIKTLVDYNAGPNATTGNGRERNGAITGISIESDGGGGNSIIWRCAWKNLLEELQDIARVAGGDFDLIKTGAATWQFRWYTGQRGTDLTSLLVFALEYGNMANPRYKYDRISEKTVAVVAGQGKGSARATEVRTGADYAASNDVETFVNASNRSSTAGLQAAGDAALDKLQARQMFVYDVLQTPSSLYGEHYCVDGAIGDLVTARYDSVEVTQKIVGVTVALNRSGGERIDVEMETQ